MNILIRFMNRFVRSAEPEYSVMLFFGATSDRGAKQPDRLIVGAAGLKEFLQNEVGQIAANAEALLLE
jgi:hypothetical protein